MKSGLIKQKPHFSPFLFLYHPSPAELLNPRKKLTSLASPALAGRFFITTATWIPWHIQGMYIVQRSGLCLYMVLFLCACLDSKRTPKLYSLVTQMVKNLPAMRETRVLSLGQKDLLEKGMATHSSILAWRIPWTEEPGGLQFMGSQRVEHD